MKKKLSIYFPLFIILICIILLTAETGCANMIPPGGGPRDSLPPVLVAAVPKDSATNFSGDRITLTFNEFVDVQNTFENVLVSPTPKNVPLINYKFRNVNIRLKDTLEPNTTYSINFGNSIKDVNEGNIIKDFTYVFSTGRTIDENSLSGKVILAETGKVDSTMIVVLHRSLDDSAVVKDKPRYIAKLDGQGNFTFRNLPAGTFALYAIPNEFSRHYDDTTKPFAFADKPISTTENTPVTLYAYALPKIDTVRPAKPSPPAASSKKEDKLLRFQTNLDGGRQDLLRNLEIVFNRKIATFDTTRFAFTDKNLKPVTNYKLTADTNNTTFTIRHSWPTNTEFNVLIDKNAFADSAGTTLAKNDTIRFTTKREDEYGSVRVRFRNLDLTRNPVLQIVQSDKIIESSPLPQGTWSRKLFPPGEYDLRILYDNNKNGKWDPGQFFGSKRQPEIVVFLNTKLAIRGNWDNEKDISL